MTCTVCQNYYSQGNRVSALKADAKKWLEGSDSLKKDTVSKHELSKGHCLAVERKPKSSNEISLTEAATALRKVRSVDTQQLGYKFRNAHAVAKWDMSFKTYVRLCELDHAKSTQNFVSYIAQDTVHSIIKKADMAKYISVTVDGCTDSSGIEQESVYIHFAHSGIVNQHFVCFTSPLTTCAEHIYNAIYDSLDRYVPGVKDKLVGLTSDGASNMMGVRKGVAALLKRDKPELIATHCLVCVMLSKSKIFLTGVQRFL